MTSQFAMKSAGPRACMRRARVFFRTLRHLLGLFVVALAVSACAAESVTSPEAECVPLVRVVDRAPVAHCGAHLIEDDVDEAESPRRNPKHGAD